MGGMEEQDPCGIITYSPLEVMVCSFNMPAFHELLILPAVDLLHA